MYKACARDTDLYKKQEVKNPNSIKSLYDLCIHVYRGAHSISYERFARKWAEKSIIDIVYGSTVKQTFVELDIFLCPD